VHFAWVGPGLQKCFWTRDCEGQVWLGNLPHSPNHQIWLLHGDWVLCLSLEAQLVILSSDWRAISLRTYGYCSGLSLEPTRASSWVFGDGTPYILNWPSVYAVIYEGISGVKQHFFGHFVRDGRVALKGRKQDLVPVARLGPVLGGCVHHA
jgi:hypothetical protein